MLRWFARAMTALVLPLSPVAAQAATLSGQVVLRDADGALKKQHGGVVVFVDGIAEPKTPYVSPPRSMVQRDKAFAPTVLPVVVGTTVEFPNADLIFHNVFSLSKAKPFDLGTYEQGRSRSVTFDQPGLLQIYCNIHPQMAASILVLSNPLFAVTDEAGRFVIESVPEGRVALRSWHALSTDLPQAWLEIDESLREEAQSALQNLSIELTEDKRIYQHKNKWGESYPRKY